MTMLSDDTDFVIGVDTHRDTHTASIVHSGHWRASRIVHQCDQPLRPC